MYIEIFIFLTFGMYIEIFIFLTLQTIFQTTKKSLLNYGYLKIVHNF